MKTSTDIAYEIALTHPKFEKKRFVATIRYQIPNRIVLYGRTKTSPRFETMYGVIYWLNKQPYHMEYTIYRIDKDHIVKQGFKKIGEKII